MKKIIVVLGCMIGICAHAQDKKTTDSLLRILQTTTIDSIKAKAYHQISNSYFIGQPDQSLVYALQGIGFSKDKKLSNYLPGLNFDAANAYNALGKDDSALYYFDQCILLAAAGNNLQMQANALRMTGYIYLNQNKYEASSKALFDGLKIAEKIKDEKLAASLQGTISTLYLNQANFDKAILYGEKSLAFFRKDGNAQRIGTLLMNLGLVYTEKKDNAKAKTYYEEALVAFKKIDYKLGLATVYGNLSNIIFDDAGLKIEYLLSAQKIWDEVAPDHPNAVGNMGNLGVAYLGLVLDSNWYKVKRDFIPATKAAILQKAESYLAPAVELCKQIEFGRDLAFFTEQLAILYEQKGEPKLANKYLHEYITLHDSLYSQENKNLIAEAEGKYEIEKKNAELAINKLTIANQQKIRIGLIAGIAFLVLIGGLLLYQNRARKKINNQLIQLNAELNAANQVKAKFFGILSHDLRSPIANLLNFLQLQKRSPELLTPELAAAREDRLIHTAESLLETMETMLLWSKGQMEQFKPATTQTKASDLFKHIEQFFAGTEQVRFEFNNPAALSFITDPDYLQTIMHNLTANAIKALQGQANAAIIWSAEKTENGVQLVIKDNGPGLAPGEAQPLLQSTAVSGSRSGLGMHIIRDLARAIGCTIRYESLPQAGTTVYLAL